MYVCLRPYEKDGIPLAEFHEPQKSLQMLKKEDVWKSVILGHRIPQFRGHYVASKQQRFDYPLTQCHHPVTNGMASYTASKTSQLAKET
jgi:hypothetical protein